MLYTILKENSAHFKAFIALQYSKKRKQTSVVIKGSPEFKGKGYNLNVSNVLDSPVK